MKRVKSVMNGITYKQEYNTENRISSIMKLASGTCADQNPTLTTKWDFAYDGDGTRVSTLTTPFDENGAPQTATLTAYYFGGAYEVTNGLAKSYYRVASLWDNFAGQTIMKDSNGDLSYFLTDHLGSVVAVTDEEGDLISQQRYLPFGGVRTNVTTPNSPNTDYGYTGQRNLDDDIGLMDYKARFYSPLLGRFISPDTVIPNLTQGLNRYSYVYNSPINYNDPSGHNPQCGPDGIYCSNNFEESYGISFEGKDEDWKEKYKAAVRIAVKTVAAKFAIEMGITNWAMAWNMVFQNGITFEIGTCNPCNGKGGYTHSSTHIEFDSENPFFDPNKGASGNYNRTPALAASLNIHNVVHEIGHAFAGLSWSKSGVTGPYSKTMPDGFLSDDGFGKGPDYGTLLWRMHSIQPGEDSTTIHREVFADMFLGWMYSNSGLSSTRRDFMDENMSIWLSNIP
jgi:RHS repeat-associated protein